MITGGSANDTGNFIINCANKIQELGNNWYKQNAAWKQFPVHVDRLRAKLEVWERESHNRGLSSHVLLNQPLNAARSCLAKEQKKLESKEARFGSTCLQHVGRTLFPDQVGLSIQGAIDALDNVQQMFETRRVVTNGLNETVEGDPFPESITNDTRYVRLTESEDNIDAALASVTSPPVVLLHGGAGKGKSTVARSTVVRYSGTTEFEHVFFLNCGPQVRIEDTLFELVQRLGSRPFANIEDDEKVRSIPIRKQVKSLLAERMVLLILDDVSDEDFVRKMVELCGPGVKCLITSRQGSLCRSLDRSKFISIEIQDIDQDIARKILASHSGLEWLGGIPAHLQKIADRMIAETDFNPLALASLGSVIDQQRSEELSEWEHASSNFFRALKYEIPVALFHSKYPRSLWATMALSISTLNEDSRNLLLLTHACAGPSVPEEVIQILYTSTKLQKDSRTFSSVRRNLESRQLIKIVTFSSSGLGQQRTWQMHSLQKRYIEEEMRDARDRIFVSLAVAESTVASTSNTSAGNAHNLHQPDEALASALCALYLDESLAGRAATQMGFPLEVFSKHKRNAIEPVTRLLALSVSDRWTATARDCATKVFLSYVCHSALEDHCISELLKNSTGAIAMCQALRDMAVIEEEAFQLDESTREVMKALVSNLTYQGIESRRKAALEVIARFADNELNDMFIVSFPGALEGIVGCLTSNS